MKANNIMLLNSYVPATIQSKYTIVADRINGKKYALVSLDNAHKKTDFLTFEQMRFFLLGMQKAMILDVFINR